jgi:hypothetical protein
LTEPEVSIRRVQARPEHQEDGLIYSGRYTDVVIRYADGCCFYSREPGWDGDVSPGHALARHRQRRASGFYRVDG